MSQRIQYRNRSRGIRKVGGLDATEFDRSLQTADGLRQNFRRADDQRTAQPSDARTRQRLYDNLRPDPRRVPHGNAETRFHSCLFYRFLVFRGTAFEYSACYFYRNSSNDVGLNMRLHKTITIGSGIGITVLLAACSGPLGAPVGAVTTVAEDRPLSEAGTDLRIKTNILTAFAEEAKGLLVDVSADVYEGQVLLTGSVKKAEDRTKAEGLARGVKDVREVFNEIQVTEEGGLKASAKDLAIETKLKANLLT